MADEIVEQLLEDRLASDAPDTDAFMEAINTYIHLFYAAYL